MPTRDELFQKWSHSPAMQEIASRDYSKVPGGTQQLLEDYLRCAFNGGFDACLAEIRRKLPELGTSPEKPARSTKPRSPKPSSIDKAL